ASDLGRLAGDFTEGFAQFGYQRRFAFQGRPGKPADWKTDFRFVWEKLRLRRDHFTQPFEELVFNVILFLAWHGLPVKLHLTGCRKRDRFFGPPAAAVDFSDPRRNRVVAVGIKDMNRGDAAPAFGELRNPPKEVMKLVGDARRRIALVKNSA